MRTGYYLRVKRDGRFQSLDIAELSKVELILTMEHKTKAEVLEWLWVMVEIIKPLPPYIEPEEQ